jgi:hypothetical protein
MRSGRLGTRGLLALATAGALGACAGAGHAVVPPPDRVGGVIAQGPARCTLQWSPSAMRDGADAFEGLEMADNVGTHPGVAHFTTVAAHDAYRIDQHADAPDAVDYDRRKTDRIRCETRGMRSPAGNVALLEGQHWLMTWSIFLPGSMKASHRFSDIWQMKYVDADGRSSGSPVFTLNLPQAGGEKLQLQAQFSPDRGGFPSADLAQLRDRWITTEVEFTIGNPGSIRWKLSDGAKTILDVKKDGIVTWPADAARLRPKWGLYRSLGDRGAINTTYMMIADLKAYLCK